MVKKIFVFIFLFSFFTVLISAEKEIDSITLKNGIVIKGKIKKMSYSSVVIVTNDGTYEIPSSEIEKVKTAENQSGNSQDTLNQELKQAEKTDSEQNKNMSKAEEKKAVPQKEPVVEQPKNEPVAQENPSEKKESVIVESHGEKETAESVKSEITESFSSFYLKGESELPQISDFKELYDFGYLISGKNYNPVLKLGNNEKLFSLFGRYKDRKTTESMSLAIDANASVLYSKEDGVDDPAIELNIGGPASLWMDSAKMTYDHYLTDTSLGTMPVFIFAEPQLWVNKVQQDGYTSEQKEMDKEFAIYGGIGLGKVYPSAPYDRVKSVILALNEKGMLKRTITQEEFIDLMGIMKNNWDSTEEAIQTLRYLESKNIIRKGCNEQETALVVIKERIEMSYGYNESGYDMRLGVTYILVKRKEHKEYKDPWYLAWLFSWNFNYEKFQIMPNLAVYKLIDPDLTMASAGAVVQYVVSPRLRYILQEQLGRLTYESIDMKFNAFSVSARYTILNLLSASVEISHKLASGDNDMMGIPDKDYAITFNLDLGTIPRMNFFDFSNQTTSSNP